MFDMSVFQNRRVFNRNLNNNVTAYFHLFLQVSPEIVKKIKTAVYN